MSMSMYIIGLLLGLAAGFSIAPSDTGSNKWALRMGSYKIPVLRLIVALILVEGFIFFLDITYAPYIGSFLESLVIFAVFLVAGTVIARLVGDVEGVKERTVPTSILLVILSGFIAFTAPALLHAIGTIILLAVVFGLFMGLKLRADIPDLGRIGPNHIVNRLRGYLALAFICILIIATVNISYHPSDMDNEFYNALVEHNTNAEREDYLTDSNEVRVISWPLATSYLQRAYGDAAAVLTTDQYVLDTNTDPSYVNDRFVWINAPRYETMKWFGGKTVPFYVYVENAPDQMARENPNVTHKIKTELAPHREKISWENRVVQIGFEAFAMEYEIAQIRFDIDDQLNPYWIVYLAERDIFYNVLNIEKLLIVDATQDLDDDSYTAYDIRDQENIPEWLEVVYPEHYIYDWAARWGMHRLGFGYRLFNKRHLYYPDDIAARFIVNNGTTYWQIPMVQQDSNVLGGYILTNTRTGETVFYNREEHSYCEHNTAEMQVRSYLRSGEIGFQNLAIHEGYLYPIKLDSGSVRECYIIPLYAGYTIQKYAIVDAQEYTAPPIIGTDLNDVIRKYQRQSYGPVDEGNTSLKWETQRIENGYIGPDEVLVTLNGTSYVITLNDLDAGLNKDADNEYRELQLAITEHQRTGNVTVEVVLFSDTIVDVDWAKANFVEVEGNRE